MISINKTTPLIIFLLLLLAPRAFAGIWAVSREIPLGGEEAGITSRWMCRETGSS